MVFLVDFLSFFFSFSSLSILFHSFLDCKVSAVKSTTSLMEAPFVCDQSLFSCCFQDSFFVSDFMCTQSLSQVLLFATQTPGVHQAPLSMEFSRQEYGNRLLFPTSGDIADPGIKPMSLLSLVLHEDSVLLHHLGSSFDFTQFDYTVS